jgi:hypothetical protein
MALPIIVALLCQILVDSAIIQVFIGHIGDVTLIAGVG